MATVPQDVTTIRTAIYGKDMREAIADAISQLNGSVTTINGRIPSNFMYVSAVNRIAGTTDDYNMVITQR